MQLVQLCGTRRISKLVKYYKNNNCICESMNEMMIFFSYLFLEKPSREAVFFLLVRILRIFQKKNWHYFSVYLSSLTLFQLCWLCFFIIKLQFICSKLFVLLFMQLVLNLKCFCCFEFLCYFLIGECNYHELHPLK